MRKWVLPGGREEVLRHRRLWLRHRRTAEKHFRAGQTPGGARLRSVRVHGQTKKYFQWLQNKGLTGSVQ